MTIRFSRRGTLNPGIGIGVATLASPSIPGAAPAKALRVGWQKDGLLRLVKGVACLKAFLLIRV